jgi:hypothetical protein
MPPASLRRLTSAALAATLLVIPAGNASFAADADGEPSLCDLLPLEEIHGLSGLRFDEPMFASAAFCVYDFAPEQTGPHGIVINTADVLFGMTFEEWREFVRSETPGIVDVTVGGQPGYIDDSNPGSVVLVVGVGDLYMSIDVAIEDSPEAGDIDPVAYALALGEASVPRALALFDTAPIALNPLAPPPLAGVEWDVDREWTGDEIRDGSSEAELGLWDLLLDASGSTFDDASILLATGRDANTRERLGAYSAFRFSGADATVLPPVISEWAREASGADDFEANDVTLGGTDAVEIVFGGQRMGFVHARDDTLFIIELDEERTARILELLP